MMEGGTAPRKVMVVSDPTRESAAALEWALSHAVMDHDELILLHVENSSSWRSTLSTFLRRPNPQAASATSSLNASSSAPIVAEGGGDFDFLEEMKRVCEAAQPKASVHAEKVGMGGQDKASTILFQSAALSVDLLVIGQRRSLSSAILGSRRSGGGSLRGTKGIDTAEFLIENSMCTCVGVQKKGQNAGYLLNTKTHKNFWLLA